MTITGVITANKNVKFVARSSSLPPPLLTICTLNFPRKFYCDHCDYHCRFQSELDSHKIVHRDQPTFQCMYPKCGSWFKWKGELSLHVEVHNKVWYNCKKCDYSTKLVKYLREHEKRKNVIIQTKLVKYLREHEKSHEKDLPYSCDLCGQKFLWRSGVKRHKEKEHKQ